MSNTTNTPLSTSNRKRVFYYDLARTIAIISISCNHAVSRSFEVHQNPLTEYSEIPVGLSFIKSVLWIFSRIGVPLFLMIYGSLLLDRNYEDKSVLKRFIKHNWIGLLLTTEIWLFIMFWYMQFMDNSLLKTEGFGNTVIGCIETMLFINQTTMPSMWYMPMILFLYLTIPIIAIAVKKIDKLYMLALSIVVAVCAMVVPNINVFLQACGVNHTFDFAFEYENIFSYYLVYVLAGYWISKGALGKVKTLGLAFGFTAFFVGTSIFQLFLMSSNSNYFVRYADIGIVLSSVCLYELLRRKADAAIVLKKPITYISVSAFGIYFLHICVMTALNKVMDRFISTQYLSRFLILEIVSFVASVFVIFITSKIGVIKKYLYMMKN